MSSEIKDPLKLLKLSVSQSVCWLSLGLLAGSDRMRIAGAARRGAARAPCLPLHISSNLLQPPPITTASPPISTPPPPISSNHLQASRLPFHLLRSPPISPHLLTQSAPLATSRHQGGYRGEYRGGVLPVRGTAGRRGDNQVTSEGLLAVLLQLVGVGAEEEALLRW